MGMARILVFPFLLVSNFLVRRMLPQKGTFLLNF